MQPEQHSTPDDATNLPIAQPVRPVPKRDRQREAVIRRRVVRAVLLGIAAALTGVFVAAFRIHPYNADGTPKTSATHTQLGMPPCNFVTLTGKPCPSCGMTTSFALLVRGDVANSMRANWVGSIMCVLWALALVWSLVSGLRGKPLFVRPGRGELVFTVIVGAMLTLMLARWTAVLIKG